MSLDTLNNGDSGLEARTKINAAIAAINAAPFQSQAWIEPGTGNDGTGVIEDSGKPFASIQAAYNAGARIFHIGKGSAGDLILSPLGDSIQLVGLGSEISSVGMISAAPTSYVTYSIRGNGVAAIKIDGIGITAPPTPNDSPAAFNDGVLNIKGFTCSGNIEFRAPAGGDGHGGNNVSSPDTPTTGTNGQNGGAGPHIYAEDVVASACLSFAGGGGHGGNGGDSTDDSTSGAPGANGGDGGYAGSVDAIRCVFYQIGAAAGDGGTGGFGGAGSPDGSPGSDGTHGPYGSISARFCDITTALSYSETPNIQFSALADAWSA